MIAKTAAALISVSIRPHRFVMRHTTPEDTDLREKGKCVGFHKFEVKQQDSTGGWHSFDDANEVDEEGYLIFVQVD